MPHALHATPALPTSIFGVVAWGILIFAPVADAALRLNEILYDPAGEDAGAEFVELWNDGDLVETLLDVSVEAGDGSRAGSWSALFVGGAADSVPPRAPYLLPAARLTGSIQNGPDAVRLTRRGVVLDLVGWGDLTSAEFFEGAPAADAASGQSLARRGDGVDSDQNGSDWQAERPTPGAPNHPALRIVLSGPRLRPEVVWPGEETSVGVNVVNAGTLPLEAGAWGIHLRVRSMVSPDDSADAAVPAGAWADGGRFGGPRLAPGDSARLAPTYRLDAPGAFACRVVSWTSVVGGGGATVEARHDSFTIVGRAGAGHVVIDEFANRDDGAGEWVELLALQPIAAWDAFALSDATGTPRPLLTRGGPRGAAAGERRVVASDPARLVSRFGIADTLLLAVDGAWPALNDGASASPGVAPFADFVRLVGPRGVPSDAVAYEETWSERGGSVERLSPLLSSASRRTWAESVAPQGGTPGGANSVAAYRDGVTTSSTLLAAPVRVLRRDGPEGAGAIVLELGPGVAERDVRLTILDLRGRVRRVLASGERFGGPAALLWDGRDDGGRPVEPGLYVARLEAARSGSAARRASVPLAVAPRGRRRP